MPFWQTEEKRINLDTKFFEQIRREAQEAAEELIAIAKPEEGSIFVVGCSSSEIIGGQIGKASSEETAAVVFDAVYGVCRKHRLYLAAQCCEHLNRAIIIEREAVDKRMIPRVNVVPQVKAGGSFATAAYRSFKNPAAVEAIGADLGLDIGDTLIGMHLNPVAVPVRLSIKQIGQAHLTAARTRLKFIGGTRAVYDENLQ